MALRSWPSPGSIVASAMALAVVLAAACAPTGSGPASGPVSTRPAPGAVVVASFDFPESRLLGELYAQALEVRGIPVARELGLGTREMVMPALQDGLVDVVPEYAASALAAWTGASLETGTAASVANGTAGPVDLDDRDAVLDALAVALAPRGVLVLRPADALNRNVLAVSATLGAARSLSDVADLPALGRPVVVGGPPECEERPSCLAPVRGAGARIDAFVPLAGAALVRDALLEGVIDVGVLFSTDPSVADPRLLVLDPSRDQEPAEHVVPLLRRDVASGAVVAALDAVSGKLTTAALQLLGWRLAHAGTTVEHEARSWLVRQGLAPRP